MNCLYPRLLLFCLTLSHQTLHSQAGSLDQSFGTNGRIKFVSVNPLLGRVIALPDGKILACASEEKPNNEFHIILRRLTNSGFPDTDFGDDSALKIDFSGVMGGLSTGEYPRDMALLPNGKILLAGTMGIQDLNNPPFVAAFVIRLTTDGLIDTSFGTGGIVTLDFDDRRFVALEMGVFPSGKFALWFTSYLPNTPYEYGLAKFSEDGLIDTAFGQSGVKILTNMVLNPGWSHLCTLDNEKIVLAGHYQSSISVYQFNSDGSLDEGFGQNGHVFPDISYSFEEIRAVKAGPDGKILTCGYAFLSGSTVFSTCRFLPNGHLDSTFHNNGIVLSALADYDCDAYSLSIQPDGKVLVTGHGIFGFEEDWLIARYLSNGDIDPSFGITGFVTTDFGSDNDYAYFATLDFENKLLVFGISESTWALARYNLGLPATGLTNPNARSGLVVNTFPSPLSSGENLELRVSVFKPGKCLAEILSLDGRVVQEFEFEAITQGLHQQYLQIHSTLPAGMYLIRLHTPDGSQALKFMKQ